MLNTEPVADEAAQCLRVRREYDVDRKALFEEISDDVAAYAKSQRGDPRKVKVVSKDVTLEDSLLTDPATMDYYGARFNQNATIRVAGPNGELPISLQLLRPPRREGAKSAESHATALAWGGLAMGERRRERRRERPSEHVGWSY